MGGRGSDDQSQKHNKEEDPGNGGRQTGTIRTDSGSEVHHLESHTRHVLLDPIVVGVRAVVDPGVIRSNSKFIRRWQAVSE